MGENTGTVYLIIGMIVIVAVGLLFAGSAAIPALTFFKGVS